MASSLSEFLKVKVQEMPTETMQVTMKDGTELEIDITGLEYRQLRKVKIEASQSYGNLNGAQVVQVEELTLAQKMAAAGIIEPSLNNRDLRDHFGAKSREELVEKMFSVNEILRIGGAVSNLTMDTEEDELDKTDSGVSEKKLEEAKN